MATHWWDVLGSAAEAVSALAATAAAVAAWRAAKASLSAGSDAREALAMLRRPSLHMRDFGIEGGRIFCRVVNDGSWPARNVEISFDVSGTVVNEQLLPDMEPGSTVALNRFGPVEMFSSGAATLRFSDVDAARYERVYEFREPSGGAVDYSTGPVTRLR